MFAFGIEHEVAFIRADGQFADYTNTSFTEFDQLIRQLPLIPTDYPDLYVGDAGIRKKRWYIEGIERFDDAGVLMSFDAKGIEIRTTVHPTIQGAVAELAASYAHLDEMARAAGFTSVALAFHPFRTSYAYDPPLTAYERQLHVDEPEYQTDHLPMVTFGPDLNLSCTAWSAAEIIDLGRKLTYYSPAIVPFSLNAPIYDGKRWDGYSVRTAIRTGARPAVRVYLADDADLISSTPILTKRARNVREVGRVEFKACDSCGDVGLYAGLLALLKGLALDTSLPGRATTPDAAAHERVARSGFTDDAIARHCAEVLAAAMAALGNDPDAALLAPLVVALEQRSCPAQAVLAELAQAGSVTHLLAQYQSRPLRDPARSHRQLPPFPLTSHTPKSTPQ
ncbi:MAG: glutamate--cysteine ligase [Oscillochloridaceae bacterium umkhey_bin13]